ncbi:MAG: antitermination protein NusB [Desulfovibrio sp.]|nr:antitermination protein NusB [Desulfovibrio sp.]
MFLLNKLPCDARSVALHALLLCDAGRHSQSALDQAFGRSGLDLRERRLSAELFYGTLRTELRCGFLLGCVLPKISRLPRPMAHILNLAVYSLLFVRSLPAYAVVHCAVMQTRLLYGAVLARVANGALRSLQRMADETVDQEFYLRSIKGEIIGHEAKWRALALYYSLPFWIVDLWRAAYGEENALGLMRRSFKRPRVGLRVNLLHPQGRDLFAALRNAAPQDQVCPVSACGLAYASGALPFEALGSAISRWVERGAVSFQAAGSLEVLERLGLADWNRPVWDCCAGYGGKSLALLEQGVAVAFCSDNSHSRLRHLSGQCGRLRLPRPVICLADSVRPPLSSWAGHILLDAPCSGLGVLSRRPDIRARRAVADMPAFAAVQDKLLRKLSEVLACGGDLAYITCTLNTAENELAVERLLHAVPAMRLVRQWQTPHDHPWMEGMFGALLRKG